MATLGGVAVGALVGVFLTEPELLRRPAQPTKLLRQNPQLLVEEDSEAGVRYRSHAAGSPIISICSCFKTRLAMIDNVQENVLATLLVEGIHDDM